METREQLLSELNVIEKWEKDQKGLWFWEKLTRLPFKMLDRFTPKFIQEKVGSLLDELGSFIQNGG
ncbi:MAG: EcsC family protein, partial [Mesobacillus sp.]|uniref:EcsC family protein n=1 Tax=Mesobacillus sp. TaxID=2675271 RepID=UPI003C59025B